MFGKKADWIKNACLAAVLLFPAVAALHGITLAALHVDGEFNKYQVRNDSFTNAVLRRCRYGHIWSISIMLSRYTGSSCYRQKLKDVFPGPWPKYHLLMDWPHSFWWESQSQPCYISGVLTFFQAC